MRWNNALFAGLLTLFGCAAPQVTVKIRAVKPTFKVANYGIEEYKAKPNSVPDTIESYDDPKNRIIIAGVDGQFYVRTDHVDPDAQRNIIYGPYLVNSLEYLADTFKKLENLKLKSEADISAIRNGTRIATLKEVEEAMWQEYGREMTEQEKIYYETFIRGTLLGRLEELSAEGKKGADGRIKKICGGGEISKYLGRSDLWFSEEHLRNFFKGIFSRDELRMMLEKDYIKTAKIIETLRSKCGNYSRGK